jgi:hypothetical protein
MAQLPKNYVQDLTQDVPIRYCGTLIFNADSNSNVINVSLYNGQEEAPQTGSVVCCVICSDGSTVPVTGGTISGNTVSVTLGADGLIPGQAGVGIQVVTGGVKTTVFKAIYNVELFETDNVVDPSSRITISVGELVSDIEAAVASIPADYSDLMAAIAPTFSTSTAYASGSYVWYSGHLYRFTANHAAGAWVGTDAVQVALADDVSDLKSAFSDLENGAVTGIQNLPVGNLIANRYITTAGNVQNYSGWSATNYVEIPNNVNLITVTASGKCGGNYNAFYKDDKTFISNFAYLSGENKISVPENAKYVRLSGTTEIMSTLALSFETLASKVSVELNDLKDKINDVTYFPDNIAYVTDGVSDTHYGVTYAKYSKNVISLYGASTGSGFFHVFNGANSYSNNGPSVPTVNLTEGYYTVYFDRSSGSQPILCYTESTYADRVEVISGQTIHVGENGGAIFLRISSGVDYGTQDNPRLCTLSIYEGINTSRYDTAIDVIARETAGYTDSPYYKGAFGTYKADFAKFYTGKNEDYTTGSLGRSTKYSEVISLFDALMAMDTAYVSKNSLGTASGTDEGGNAYTLYEYVFTANAYKPDGLATAAVLKKNPVILCDAAIHGFEKNSTYGLYYFLYDLVNNYADDPVLSAIRENVTIKIIPVSNPYGFDNNSYVNGNGVNINRNFYDSKWAPDAEDATGEEPFDQPESVIIRDWVLANQRDLMAYFNMHTNGQYSAVSFSEANALMPKFKRSNNDPYYNRLAYIIQRHIQMQTNKFRDMYSLDISGFFGKYQGENNSVGTASVWATEQAKVVSMTFEMFNGISINDVSVIALFSAESKKICSELIGNMIAQTVFEYSDR